MCVCAVPNLPFLVLPYHTLSRYIPGELRKLHSDVEVELLVRSMGLDSNPPAIGWRNGAQNMGTQVVMTAFDKVLPSRTF